MYAQCVYLCMYVWGGGGILCNFITCRFMEPLPSARRLLIKKSKASPGRLCNIVISLLSFWCCWTPFVPAFARNNFLKLSSECIFHPFTFNCLLLSAHFWSAGWVFPSGSFLDSFLKNAGSVCALFTVCHCFHHLSHDFGPFVLLYLLGERLLFAFHITDSVPIESGLLCVVSNANNNSALVFLD